MSGTTSTSMQLSAATLLAIQTALNPQNTDGSRYAVAYKAIANDLATQQLENLPVDPDSLTWFTSASQINDPSSQTFMHYFARAYVDVAAGVLSNTVVQDSVFQNASNSLAQNVLRQIAASGAALPFSILGPVDTLNIATAFGGNPLYWPGYADLIGNKFTNHDYASSLSSAQKAQVYFFTIMAAETASIAISSHQAPGVPPTVSSSTSLAWKIHRPFRGSASEARRLAHRMCSGVAPGARFS